MSWRLDHVVHVVTDLEDAVERYSRAGFNVVRGGRHVHAGVENGLIGLADGSYIELFSFVDLSRASPSHANWPTFQRGGGLATFWFCTSELDADVARVRAAGVPLEAPRAGSRVRPDGYEVKFRLAVPSKRDFPHVPALIEDVTPRAERVPADTDHVNRIQRVSVLTVAVPDAASAQAFYAAVGDTEGPRLRFVAPTGQDVGLAAVELEAEDGRRFDLATLTG